MQLIKHGNGDLKMSLYKKVDNQFIEICVKEAAELTLEQYESYLHTENAVLNDSVATENYLKLKLAGLEYEVFGMLILDSKNRLIKSLELFRGTINQSRIYVREIIRELMRHNGASTILYHNHPSGDPTPSKSDIDITKKIREITDILDFNIYDHLIIGKDRVYSLTAHGQL